MGNYKAVEIETDRLVLRPFELEKDLEAYGAIMGDYEVARWLAKGESYSLQDVERIINYDINHWIKYGYGTWAVTDKDTGALLGHCGLNFIPNISEVEVLYAFGRNAWGKGYATEAAKASLDYGFQKAGLNTVIGIAKPMNESSQKVMKKIGLEYIKNIELYNQELVYYRTTKEQWLLIK